MDKAEKQKLLDSIKELTKKVDTLQEEMRQSQMNKRQYTQSDVFETRVTFRQPVYDKNGTKVIN